MILAEKTVDDSDLTYRLEDTVSNKKITQF
jgi:hypothetical protein